MLDQNIETPVVRRTPAAAPPVVPPVVQPEPDGQGNGHVAVDDHGTRDVPPTFDGAPAETVVAPAPDGRLTEEQARGWLSSAWKKVTSTAKKVVGKVSGSVVKAGLTAAGTAAGGFIGGPVGAALGGKAGSFAAGFFREVPQTADEFQARALRAAEDQEVESAQLADIVEQVLEPALLVVLDEMERDAVERGARGEGGPADDEVMERFWKQAFSKIASTVADELPWAITKATQYLGRSGTRDANTIDPLMLDPETAQRLWAPSFSGAIAAIQSSLPELFQQFSGGPRSRGDGTISWSDLEQTTRLEHGDNITVTDQSEIDDVGVVEIGLEIPPHKAWWKQIQVRGADDAVIGSVEVEGEVKSGRVRVPADSLGEPGAYVVFTKEDGFYKLPASELPQPGGYRYDFYWYAG